MNDDSTRTLSRRGVLGLGLGLGLTAATASTASALSLVTYQYQVQQTQSWCSAASARIAMTARGRTPTQASLANSLGLVNGQGLQDPYAIARVMNNRLGIADHNMRYRLYIPAAGTLKARLRARVEASIGAGYAVVINMNQVNNDYFPAGHYIAIVGYDNTRYKIADPYTSKRNGVWRNEDKIVEWNKLNRFTAFGT